MFRKLFWITIRFLNGFVIWTAFTSIATTVPIMNRRSVHCEVIFCSYYANWPIYGCIVHFQNVHAWITFRKSFRVLKSSESGFLGGSRSKTPLSSHFKSLIWKNFAFTKGKIRLLNRERVRITIQNGLGNTIHSFVNRPFIWSVTYHALLVERHHKGSRRTPHEDNSPPDKNKAQPLPTRAPLHKTFCQTIFCQ